MGYNWETENFDNLMGEESPTETAPTGMNSIEEIDEVMSEAEKRFEVAQYYKLLLQDSLFQNQTDASERVEAEIRAFIKERLGVLLGVKSASNSASGFSPEQVSVLTSFADLGEDAPEMLKSLMGRIFKKMDKKVKVKEEPALRTVKEPVKPALRKVEEPRLRNTTDNRAMADQPKPRGRPPKNMKLPIPEQYKNDPTLKIEGNKIYVQARTTDGQPLWEKVDNETRPLYKDITPAARPTGTIKPIPIPRGDALAMTMQQSAQRTLNETDKGSSLILNQLGNE